MTEEMLYKTKIYKGIRAFIYTLLFLFTLTASAIYIAGLLNEGLIVVIVIAITGLLLFLFKKRCMALFIRPVEIRFDEVEFSVKEFGRINGAFIKVSSVAWADIKTYNLYLSDLNQNFSIDLNQTNLTINSKKGSKKYFVFRDEKDDKQTAKETGVYGIFTSYIKIYNSNKQFNEKIAAKHGNILEPASVDNV